MINDDNTSSVADRYEAFINPSVARLLKLLGLTEPEYRASGVWIYDSGGRRFLDLLGGYGVFGIGHRHSEVIAAVKRQLDLLPLSGKLLFNAAQAELAELLAELTPGDIQYSFFVNSGAEAVEGAIKLARIHTGRSKIIAMHNSFHGKTLGALSATGREIYRAPFAPLLADFIHVPYGDIAALEPALDGAAAVLLEPVQGEGGVIVPPAGYLKAARQLCTASGCLLIADEVQTGLGRTGRFFAVEHETVVPDIIVLAKALGGGVMPIGSFSARAAVWDKYIEAPFLHTSTFGGNQLACAAAIAALKVLKRDYEQWAVPVKGAYFLQRLKDLQKEYPEMIVAARGRGLLLGVELASESLGGFVMSECLKRDVLVAYTLNNPRVIRIEPPFIITFTQIDYALDVLAGVFKLAGTERGGEVW